jgi:hypothetical protein
LYIINTPSFSFFIRFLFLDGSVESTDQDLGVGGKPECKSCHLAEKVLDTSADGSATPSTSPATPGGLSTTISPAFVPSPTNNVPGTQVLDMVVSPFTLF